MAERACRVLVRCTTSNLCPSGSCCTYSSQCDETLDLSRRHTSGLRPGRTSRFPDPRRQLTNSRRFLLASLAEQSRRRVVSRVGHASSPIEVKDSRDLSTFHLKHIEPISHSWNWSPLILPSIIAAVKWPNEIWPSLSDHWNAEFSLCAQTKGSAGCVACLFSFMFANSHNNSPKRREDERIMKIKILKLCSRVVWLSFIYHHDVAIMNSVDNYNTASAWGEVQLLSHRFVITRFVRVKVVFGWRWLDGGSCQWVRGNEDIMTVAQQFRC